MWFVGPPPVPCSLLAGFVCLTAPQEQTGTLAEGSHTQSPKHVCVCGASLLVSSQAFFTPNFCRYILFSHHFWLLLENLPSSNFCDDDFGTTLHTRRDVYINRSIIIYLLDLWMHLMRMEKIKTLLPNNEPTARSIASPLCWLEQIAVLNNGTLYSKDPYCHV